MASRPPPATTALFIMTTAERVGLLQALYTQLDGLLTTEEHKTYPALMHLGDLIEDLQLDLD